MDAEDSEPSASKPPPKAARNDRALERPRQAYGYRAGARVEGGRHRAELVVAAAMVIVAGAFGIAALDIVVEPPPLPSDIAVRSQDPSDVESSPLPALEISDIGAPTRPMALLAGGLRWLDPTTGRLSGTPYEAFEGAPLVDRDGSVLCVCVERPWQQHGATALVTLVRGTGPDDAVTRSEVVTIETPTDDPFGEPIALETAMAPDWSAIYIATLVAGDEGYAAAILAVDPQTAEVTGRADVPLPRGEQGPAFSTLRVAPDGRSMILTVWSTPALRDPEVAWAAHAFRVTITGGSFGSPQAIPPVDERRGGPGCFGEAFVAADVYAALCGRPADAADALSLVTSDPVGGTRSLVLPVGLGAPLDAAVDALIDAAGGRTYIWSPERHTLVRIDARTGDVASRTFTRGDLTAVTPRLPDATGSTVHWSRFTGAQDIFTHHTIAASSDGTVLYAMGASPRGASRMLPSTGILAVDPATLALLDVWAPAAYYNDIAVTGDGGYVVGLGLGGIDTAGLPARWQDSISFHARDSGRVVEIIGTIDGLSGWTPVLLQGSG